MSFFLSQRKVRNEYMYNSKEYFSKSNCSFYLNNKKRGFFYPIVINYKVSNNFSRVLKVIRFIKNKIGHGIFFLLFFIQKNLLRERFQNKRNVCF